MSRKTRKLIWSVPLVATLAIVGALALFMTLAPNAAQAVDEPGKVLNLEAIADTEGIPQEEIELTWDAPADGGPPRHYRIDVSENGGYTWQALELRWPGTRYFHTGLSADKMFHYRVFAVNPEGTGPVSEIVYETTAASAAPDAPTGLTAVVGPNDSENDEDDPTVLVAATEAELTISVSWNASSDPDGAPVTHYVLEYSVDEGRFWEELADEIEELMSPHAMLDAGVEYYYRVAAVNSVGQSDWSHSNKPYPSAATNRGALPMSLGTLRAGVSPEVPTLWLYWDVPMNQRGAPVTSYDVQGRPASQFNEEETPALVPCAVATCPLQVIKSGIDVPKAMYIHSFQVTERDVNANTDYDDDFVAGVPWIYQVRAVNSAGDGTWAELAVPARAVDATPIRPERLGITRSINTAHNDGRTGLTLMWDKSTSQDETDATAYRVEYSETGPAEGGYNWQRLGSDDVSGNDEDRQDHTDGYTAFPDSPADPPALLGGDTRHYRVFALLDSQMSWPSEQRSGTTAPPLQPAAPTGLNATGTGHTTIMLTWTAPTADVEGGDDLVIDHYVIQVWDDARRRWEEHETTAGAGTEFEHDGLEPEQTVKYRVAAVNSASSRAQYEWSDEDEATTLPLALPNEPGGLAAEADGHTSIKLCWNSQATKPEDAPVTSYLIEYSPDGKADTWKKLADVTDADSDGNVHTIYTDSHQLEAGDTRHYRVFAVNSRGQSDQSDADSATTAAAMAPGAPTLTLGTVTDTEVNFSWTAPADDGGSAVTGWIVEKAYGGSFLDEMRTNTDAFTDAQTWWDGLDCSARVMAVMDDGTADMDNPFCAMMYADLGDTEEAEVERVFAARYFVIDDAAANTYRNYNLLPETERMYRVAAVNGVGIGMWSNAITATTEQANAAPAAGAAIANQTVTAGGTVMVQSTITDADADDTLEWSVESDMPTYATAEVDDMGMVTITGVAAGSATITVTATDIADETATQDVMVTVEAAGTALTAPSGVVVSTSTFGNTKSISVTWDTTSIQNAEQIKVALFNSDVTALAQPLITINPANDRGAHTFSDVPSGTYYVTVASFRTGERHKLSLPLQEVTVE